MANNLPNMVVLSLQTLPDSYLYYFDKEDHPGRSRVSLFGTSVFNPLSKIQIEPSKNHHGLVSLLFVHINRYWLPEAPQGGATIYATAAKPDETITSPSCTLFRPEIKDGKLYLRHAHTNMPLIRSHNGLVLDTNGGGGALTDRHALKWVNAEELVELPEFVAFKGYNDKYLKAHNQGGYRYLRFNSDDPNKDDSAYQVLLMDDGHLVIKSVYFNKFLRPDPTWIWADSSDEYDKACWFKAIKVGGKIVLQSASNGSFCRSLTADGKVDCLNANIRTMARETMLEVEELVSEKKVENVRFRTDLVRVFDERPYTNGRTDAINESDQDMPVSVKISVTEKTTETVTNSASRTIGAKATVNIGPAAASLGSVETSFELTRGREWGKTTERETTTEASGQVNVPKRSKAIVEYVGTQGSSSIPFSYTQVNTSSLDGQSKRTDHIDGIFTAVKYYGFQFTVRKTVPL